MSSAAEEIHGEPLKRLRSLPDEHAFNGAIRNAADACVGAEGLTALVLQAHLKKLCKMQRKWLSGDGNNN